MVLPASRHAEGYFLLGLQTGHQVLPCFPGRHRPPAARQETVGYFQGYRCHYLYPGHADNVDGPAFVFIARRFSQWYKMTTFFYVKNKNFFFRTR